MRRKLLHLLSALGGGSYSLLFGGLGIIVLLCIARAFGLMEAIELKTLDFFLRWRPAEATDEHITILEITEEDLQKQNIYPISDDFLRELFIDLKEYEPQAIGLDMFRDLPVVDPTAKSLEDVQNSNRRLRELIQNSPEIVVVERILDSPVSPPPDIPLAQVGFVDLLIDEDGFYRTSLLASPSPSSSDNRYHLSFALQLASRYLAAEGFDLNNGIRDPVAVRFGNHEFQRLLPNSGGYVDEEIADVPVMLINFRSGKKPFDKLSLSQFMAGAFSEELIRNRIVLIGLTADSTPDYVNSSAIVGPNPALVSGVEFHAHATSQLIDSVLAGRPLLKPLPTILEYIWIIFWGGIGISLIHLAKPIPAFAATFILLGSVPIISGYGLVFVGLWIPVFPAWLIFFLNGSSALFYRSHHYEQSQKIRLSERQRMIRRSYNMIHNGPLQTLKGLISHIASESSNSENTLYIEELGKELSTLNEQLRHIHEFMQEEQLESKPRMYLGQNNSIYLSDPLHSLLYQVYYNRIIDADYFKQVKKSPDFGPMNAKRLNSDDKEDIVRFLEEALCNVERHAIGVTHLTVICKPQGDENIVQVIDNGKGEKATETPHIAGGRGTQSAKALALRLGGDFSRQVQPSGGMVCTLTWPIYSRPLRTKLSKWLQSSVKQSDKAQEKTEHETTY